MSSFHEVTTSDKEHIPHPLSTVHLHSKDSRNDLEDVCTASIGAGHSKERFSCTCGRRLGANGNMSIVGVGVSNRA